MTDKKITMYFHDLNYWRKLSESSFWTNKNGDHPEINSEISIKDVENGTWIPEDNIDPIIKEFLLYQESIPKENRQFWFPPFKIEKSEI